LWASNGKTPVTVGGPCTSDGARHTVCLSALYALVL